MTHELGSLTSGTSCLGAPAFDEIRGVQRMGGGDYNMSGGGYSQVTQDTSTPSEVYKAPQEFWSGEIIEALNKTGGSHKTRAFNEGILNDILPLSAIAATSQRAADATYREALSGHKEDFSQEGLSELQNQEDSKHVPHGAQIEIANLFNNLMNDWKLSKREMATLLGLDFDASGKKYVERLLTERCSFSGRDTRYRMAQLIQIREILFALFKGRKVENEWLRGKQNMLNNKAPMDLLLEGPPENLVLVREFVETVAGR